MFNLRTSNQKMISSLFRRWTESSTRKMKEEREKRKREKEEDVKLSFVQSHSKVKSVTFFSQPESLFLILVVSQIHKEEHLLSTSFSLSLWFEERRREKNCVSISFLVIIQEEEDSHSSRWNLSSFFFFFSFSSLLFWHSLLSLCYLFQGEREGESLIRITGSKLVVSASFKRISFLLSSSLSPSSSFSSQKMHNSWFHMISKITSCS